MGNKRDPFEPLPCVANGERGWKLDLSPKIAGTRKRFFWPAGEELLAIQEGNRYRELYAEKGRSAFTDTADHGGILLSKAVRLFLENKEPKTGKRNYKLAKTYLDDLVESLGDCTIDSITGLRLEKWFNRPGWAGGSRFQAFSYARMFFNWLEKHRMIQLGRNPAAACDPPKRDDQKNNALDSERALALLKATEGDDVMRAYVCLGLFGGLRTKEILGLNWSMVNWRDAEVHVGPDISKESTGIRNRYVKVLPPFRRFCPRIRAGMVIPMNPRNFRIARDKIKKALNWAEWPENCLRDSFASHSLVITKDAPKVAYQLGHSSVKMVLGVYARAFPERESRRFINLKASMLPKIVPLKLAA